MVASSATSVCAMGQEGLSVESNQPCIVDKADPLCVRVPMKSSSEQALVPSLNLDSLSSSVGDDLVLGSGAGLEISLCSVLPSLGSSSLHSKCSKEDLETAFVKGNAGVKCFAGDGLCCKVGHGLVTDSCDAEAVDGHNKVVVAVFGVAEGLRPESVNRNGRINYCIGKKILCKDGSLMPASDAMAVSDSNVQKTEDPKGAVSLNCQVLDHSVWGSKGR